MSTSWMNGKPQVATAEEVAAKWGGIGFVCQICGRKFAVGDTWRWVYMNGASPSPGNFKVCGSCDQSDIAERVRAALRKYEPHMEPWVLLYLMGEKERQ